jgi:murein DD-endopeptidase / murein LD-carboxypeptidase
MSERGDAIVRRARALLGVRFRPQGRDPEQGLDCIGVVTMATGIAARRVRRDYCLHSNDPDEVNGQFDGCGFIRIAPAAAVAGDVLLVRPNPIALHAVILTDSGYLHADMRARRVVEVPGQVPWPTLSAWRHPDRAAEDPFAPELIGPPSARRFN